MSIGLRQLLLLAATIVFIIAIFIQDANWFRWASVGLALMAASAVVKEMGWDRMLNSAGHSSSSSSTSV
jgi:heme O synthase-like polyprenyltransferase